MRKLMISLFVVIVFGAVAASVTANEATIKYRQGHLAAMGGHTNAVFQLFGETKIRTWRSAWIAKTRFTHAAMPRQAGM